VPYWEYESYRFLAQEKHEQIRHSTNTFVMNRNLQSSCSATFCCYLFRDCCLLGEVRLFDPEIFVARMWAAFPLVLLTKILCLYYLHCYRGMWRFTSLSDMINIIKSAVLGSIIAVVGIALGSALKIPPFDFFDRFVLLGDCNLRNSSGYQLFYQRYVPTTPILSLSLPVFYRRQTAEA